MYDAFGDNNKLGVKDILFVRISVELDGTVCVGVCDGFDDAVKLSVVDGVTVSVALNDAVDGGLGDAVGDNAVVAVNDRLYDLNSASDDVLVRNGIAKTDKTVVSDGRFVTEPVGLDETAGVCV